MKTDPLFLQDFVGVVRPPKVPVRNRDVPLSFDMRQFPHVWPSVRSAHAKFLGAAGEYLVDSVLVRRGLPVWTAPDLHHADRLVEVDGLAISLQIKTVTMPVDGFCSFSMQRGNARAGGVRPYGRDAFDIAVLVVLSHNAVKFVPNMGRSFRVWEEELPDLHENPWASLEFSIQAALRLRTCRYG